MLNDEVCRPLLAALRRLHRASAADLSSLLVNSIADLTLASGALVVLADDGGTARVVASKGLQDAAADSFASPLDSELPVRLRQHFQFLPDEELPAAPLMAGEHVRGLLVAWRPGRAEAGRTLMALSEHAAMALERIDTERRRAAAEQAAASAQSDCKLLAALLRSLPVALWVTDAQGRPRLASGRAHELAAPGMPFLRPGELLPAQREHPLCRALGEIVAQEEWLLATSGGQDVPLLCSAGPLRDENGELLGAVLIGQDLREHKEAEACQRQQAAEEEAGKAKDVFFNALSHELRTPLAAILFALEVLQHPNATPAQRERASRTIERNVHQQVRLIDDLLDISRILRKRAQVQLRPVELRELLSVRQTEFDKLARQTRLTLTMRLPADPLQVLGDRGRLEQVLNILIENAMKFTDAGGSVEVLLSREEDWAVLRVRDTGAGIDPELMPRLFQPLEQGDRSLSRSRGGLGAGLAIARWIVEQHGGQTAACSGGRGAGSEFIVRLPIHAQPSLSILAEERPTAADVSMHRIMVVEDNHDLLDTLVALLQMLGHRVVAAASGRGALEAAQREHPEVAFIDIGLPDMDGYQLARQFRSDQTLHDMRLVALTGYASEDNREQALRAGFDEYLAKPVDMETIRHALGRTIR